MKLNSDFTPSSSVLVNSNLSSVSITWLGKLTGRYLGYISAWKINHAHIKIHEIQNLECISSFLQKSALLASVYPGETGVRCSHRTQHLQRRHSERKMSLGSYASLAYRECCGLWLWSWASFLYDLDWKGTLALPDNSLLIALAWLNPDYPTCVKDSNLCQFVSIHFKFLKHYLLGLDHFYFRSLMIFLLKISLILPKLKHCLEPAKISDFFMNKITKNCYSPEVPDTQFWAPRRFTHFLLVFHKISFWLDTDRAVLIQELWPYVLFRSDCSQIILLHSCEVILKLFFKSSSPSLIWRSRTLSPLKSPPRCTVI